MARQQGEFKHTYKLVTVFIQDSQMKIYWLSNLPVVASLSLFGNFKRRQREYKMFNF